LGAVKPVFGNLRAHKRLDRFTICGRAKVDAQWKRYGLVHKINQLRQRRLRRVTARAKGACPCAERRTFAIRHARDPHRCTSMARSQTTSHSLAMRARHRLVLQPQRRAKLQANRTKRIALSLDGYLASEGMTIDNPEYKG